MGNSAIIRRTIQKPAWAPGRRLWEKRPDATGQTPAPRLVMASVEEGMPRFGFTGGVQDIPAWGDMLKKVNLAGLADKICCPLLNLWATGAGRPCKTTPALSSTLCRIRAAASSSPPRTREPRSTGGEAIPASCTRSASIGWTRSSRPEHRLHRPRHCRGTLLRARKTGHYVRAGQRIQASRSASRGARHASPPRIIFPGAFVRS
jgi:hypothetical protein